MPTRRHEPSPGRKWLHRSRGDCRQRQMDAKRICHVIFLTLIPFWTGLGQDKGAESAKSEALTLKAQMVEFENLKAEIKAQEDKIDRLTQEVAKLAESL